MKGVSIRIVSRSEEVEEVLEGAEWIEVCFASPLFPLSLLSPLLPYSHVRGFPNRPIPLSLVRSLPSSWDHSCNGTIPADCEERKSPDCRLLQKRHVVYFSLSPHRETVCHSDSLPGIWAGSAQDSDFLGWRVQYCWGVHRYCDCALHRHVQGATDVSHMA